MRWAFYIAMHSEREQALQRGQFTLIALGELRVSVLDDDALMDGRPGSGARS